MPFFGAITFFEATPAEARKVLKRGILEPVFARLFEEVFPAEEQ